MRPEEGGPKGFDAMESDCAKAVTTAEEGRLRADWGRGEGAETTASLRPLSGYWWLSPV